jgi:hypothetical protein
MSTRFLKIVLNNLLCSKAYNPRCCDSKKKIRTLQFEKKKLIIFFGAGDRAKSTNNTSQVAKVAE